jgi:prophage tail gpP-like protein
VFFLSDTLGTTPGVYSAEVTGLTAGTEYFFKIFAINSEGVANGDWVSFTTEPGDPPSVLTSFASEIEFFGARLNGQVFDEGEGPVTSRGFVVATRDNPVIGQSGVINLPAGTGVGTFNATIAGLDPATLHYFRAYAANAEAGRGYGDTETFTTKDPEAPTGLTLDMPEIDEDDVSTGTVTAETDPMETGSYVWQVAPQTSPPYSAGTSATLTVDGLTAGTVAVIDQDDSARNAQIRFTPTPDWFGTARFSYRVSNGFAFSDWQQVSVTVRPVPDAPSAVIGELPDTDEDTPAGFSLTWTDPDDLPPGTLAATDGYVLQARPASGGAWLWLQPGARDSVTVPGAVIRILSYSTTALAATLRVEPTANYNGPYAVQFRVLDRVDGDDRRLFGPARLLSATIASVPDAPSAPRPSRMPTAQVGQNVQQTFTTFDPDTEDTSWTFELAAVGSDTWATTLTLADVGTLSVIDDDLSDQQAQVRLEQQDGGATELRYAFLLRVTDSSGLVGGPTLVTGFLTPPRPTVFLQKVQRVANSPIVTSLVALAPLTQLTRLTVTDALRGPGSAEVSVATDEIRRRAEQVGLSVADLLEPGETELVVSIGGQPVFCGPLGDVQWDATSDTMNLSARGLAAYLEDRVIGPATTSFVGEDLSGIIADLVMNEQARDYGDLLITDETIPAGTNGTFEFSARTRIADAIDKVAKADGGPDVWVTADRELRTAAARGTDRRASIRLTAGMMTVASWTNRDEQTTTVATVIGGPDGEFSGTFEDPAGMARYGRRTRVIAIPELQSNEACADYAERLVKAQARRAEAIAMEVLVTADRRFSVRDLEVGDIVTVDLRDPQLGQVVGDYRIAARTFDLIGDTADAYRVTLDVVPAVTDGGAVLRTVARTAPSVFERLAQLDAEQRD